MCVCVTVCVCVCDCVCVRVCVCVTVCVWCAEMNYGGLVNFELIFHMYEHSSLAGYLYRHMANLLFVYSNDSSV